MIPRGWLLRFSMILCLGGMVVPATLVAEELEYHGSIFSQYRLQSGQGYRYQTFEPIATMDVGNSLQNRFSASVQGGGVFILSGKTSGSPFLNVYDTFDNREIGRLYHAYVNIQDVGPIQNIRIGRQHKYEFEQLYFDGGTFDTKPLANVTVSAYGGIPVHFYQNQIGEHPKDWLVGSTVQWQPVQKLQVRFDYVHINTQADYFQPNIGNRATTLYSGDIWWDISSKLTLKGTISSFGNQLRDTSGLLIFKLPAQDLSVQVKVYRLLEAYSVRVNDLDMFSFMQAYLPYTEFYGSLYKGFGKHVAMQLGGSARLLDDYQVASAFNHGYERAFATLTTMDLIVKGLTLNATGDYYHSDDNTLKNNYFGGTFSATQKFLKDRLKATLGTAYYLYSYNLATGNESNNVQTYYAQVKSKIVGGLEGRLGFRYEHSIANFYTGDARLIWSF